MNSRAMVRFLVSERGPLLTKRMFVGWKDEAGKRFRRALARPAVHPRTAQRSDDRGSVLLPNPLLRCGLGRVRAHLSPRGRLGADREPPAATDRGLLGGNLRRLVRGDLAAAGDRESAHGPAGSDGSPEDRGAARRLMTPAMGR